MKQDQESLIKKIKEGKCRELILRKDIVIPAGTSLKRKPHSTTTRRSQHCYVGDFTLSRESWGEVRYAIDPSSWEDTERLISNWFIVI